MTIQFRCPSCNKKLSVSAAWAGRERTCPNCNAKFVVPYEEAPGDEKDLPRDHPLLLFPKRQEHGDLIDMTAMVDIVFFLLIFFMVTSMQALEAVINLPTPQASEGAASTVQAVPDYVNDPDYVVVTIDADDAVFVENEEATSELDLRAKLRTALRDGDRQGMLIQGDGDATHGKFVMVLDAGADAGVKELLFSVDQSEAQATGG